MAHPVPQLFPPLLWLSLTHPRREGLPDSHRLDGMKHATALGLPALPCSREKRAAQIRAIGMQLAHLKLGHLTPQRDEELLVCGYMQCAGAALASCEEADLEGRTEAAWEWAVKAGRGLGRLRPEAQAELLQLMNDLTLRCAPSEERAESTQPSSVGEEPAGSFKGEGSKGGGSKEAGGRSAIVVPTSLVVATLSASLGWIRMVHLTSLPAAIGLAGQALALFWELSEECEATERPATEAALALERELCHIVEAGSEPLSRVEAAAALAEAARSCELLRAALPALRSALETVPEEAARAGAQQLLEATEGQLSSIAQL